MRVETAGLLAVAAMLISGVCSALQPPTNALIVRASGSAINAAFVSFAVGTLVLSLLAGLLRDRPDLGVVASTPWFGWMGGVYGAVFVTSAAYAAPRLGVASTLTLLIAGQAAAALAIDHWGALGAVRHPITGIRLAGMALVVGGVLLVRRG